MGDAAVLISTDRLQLNCFDYFPTELLDVPAHDLWRHLQGPSLFQLGGRHDQPLFVSVLLHGNEVQAGKPSRLCFAVFMATGCPDRFWSSSVTLRQLRPMYARCHNKRITIAFGQAQCMKQPRKRD